MIKCKDAKSNACACCQALSGVGRGSLNGAPQRKRRRRRSSKSEKNQGKQSASLLDKVLGYVRKENEKPAASSAAAGGGAPAAAADPAGAAQDPEWSGEIKIPKPKKIWHGLDGLAVTAFGIGAPAAMIAFSAASMPKRITLMLLNHPVETAAEILLLALVPYANYFVWSAITKGRLKFSRGAAMALGASIATCGITAAVCIAAMFAQCEQFAEAIGTDFSTGFAWMAGLALLAGAASLYVAYRVRNTWDLDSTRRQIVLCTGIGIALAAGIFGGAEVKSWLTRSAERMAVSAKPEEAKQGLALLRDLNPERELRMECSDSRAAGLAGLFLPLKASDQHELYFKLTGKPYSFREFANADVASMPDEFLSANLVGERIKGLSLARSTMIGAVHPQTLTSTFDWTFVFKNDTQQPKEMRAELSLPPGAVINGFTVWTKGDASDAKFIATPPGNANGSYYGGVNSPGMVTDLGHGRFLVSAYPVPQDEEAKVRVSMVIPLNPDATRSASLVLPKFISTNFDLEGEQVIRMHSSMPLTAGLKALEKSRTRDGEYVLAGNVSGDDLQSSRLVIESDRPAEMKPVYVFDPIATKEARDEQKRKEQQRREAELAEQQQQEKDEQVVVWIDGSKGLQGLEEMRRSVAAKHHKKNVKHVVKVLENRYISERTQKLSAPAPRTLQIVVDGSATVGPFAQQLADALKRLPASIPAEVVLASQEDQQLATRTELKKALELLPKVKFVGGQDNLKAIVNASERAGDTKGGAVLWIHGPQPALNHEIYIMSPYASLPKFYELPLGSGDTTDTVEFFRNHSEIGPFVQIARTADHAADDLQAFFRKWEANNSAFEAKFALHKTKPADAVEASPAEARELLTLRAAQATEALIKAKLANKAYMMADK